MCVVAVTSLADALGHFRFLLLCCKTFAGFRPGKLIDTATCLQCTQNAAKKVLGAREEAGGNLCSIQLQVGA